MEKRSSKIAAVALACAGGLLMIAVGHSLYRDRPPAVVANGVSGTLPAAGSVEDRVRADPTDVAGWEALGAEQFGRGRFGEAERSYVRATKLAPTHAGLWSALGEARVMASARDPMPAPALAAFRKALALDPADPRSRYFIAVQRDLSGDHAGAIADWLTLLKDTPPGAPWEADLRRTIEQVGKINGIATAPRLAAITPPAAHPVADSIAAGVGGPTPDQMRAAAALRPSEQAAMVDGMVSSVEAKLRADPGDIARWEMLMRSRMTLNQPTQAAAALKSAIAANPSARDRLQATAATLGIR